MRTSAIVFALCAALVPAVSLTGCGVEEVKPDGASGKDFERAGAQELFLDKLTDDFVDPEVGDATDWKFFKLREKGILTLTVYWDNKNVRSIIDVRDRFGALLDSRRHSSEIEKDVLELKVEPGTHFVRLFSEKGGSVYTIEAVFQQFDHSPSDDFRPAAVTGDILGDPLGEAKPKPRKRGRSRRGRSAAPPADTGGGGPTSSARIIRMVPGPGGKGLMLTIDKGTAAGVSRGATGWIVDDGGGKLKGGAITVRNAGERSSTAFTRLDKKEVAHRRRVKVRLQ